MDIHIVSSLTSDDEAKVALVVLHHLVRVLDRLPIAYVVSVSTASERVCRHSCENRDDGALASVAPSLSET